jgi:hypothetical protein
MPKYLYFYYSRPIPEEDSRKATREYTLVAKDQFPKNCLRLRDLEGMLITNNQIPFGDQTFLEERKKQVAEQYVGEFLPFTEFS